MNHLQHESSPYLRMHMKNPVDWYSYSQTALDKARKERKLIFISIGYTACHWCHVMAHESFEREEIAKILNEYFVSIKVDREEQPDLDLFYQKFARIAGKNGGWPLSVFLTPEGLPFFIGTYFPPQSRYGLIGFPDLLLKLVDIYNSQTEKVVQSGKELLNVLSQDDYSFSPTQQSKSQLFKDFQEDSQQENYFSEILGKFWLEMDPENGGFGSAPKFPNFTALLFLIQQLAHFERIYQSKEPEFFEKTQFSSLKARVKKTLDKMIYGGIYDQIGGGFHRYSVDHKWITPHFEKMLYDNAMALQVYTEAALYFKNVKYHRVVREILEWLFREMHDEESGGFFSTICADSEGEEGKFYVWQKKDLEKLLSQSEFKIMSKHFGISEKGNFANHSNILIVASTIEEIAKEMDIPVGELAKQKEIIKNKLLQARMQKTMPVVDNKILTAWNSLLLEGLFSSLRIFAGDPLYSKITEHIKKLQEFIIKKMLNQENYELKRVFSQNRAKISGTLEDYTYYIHFLIQYYFITGDLHDFSLHDLIEKIISKVLAQFWDDNKKIFYFSTNQNKDTKFNTTIDMDVPLPAPSMIMLKNLLIWSEVSQNPSYKEIVDQALIVYKTKLERYGSAAATFFQVMQLRIYMMQEIVYMNESDSNSIQKNLNLLNGCESLFQMLKSYYLPFKIIGLMPEIEGKNYVIESKRGFRPKKEIIGTEKKAKKKEIYFFCEKGTCYPPIYSLAEFSEILGTSVKVGFGGINP
ncbi:MAG: thioredoxin domain-containing protein [Promethearchaeota archaeon]